jgi:hypothetical protein
MTIEPQSCIAVAQQEWSEWAAKQASAGVAVPRTVTANNNHALSLLTWLF